MIQVLVDMTRQISRVSDLMAGIPEALSDHQREALVFLKEWYRHYLVAIREVSAKCKPIPLVSDFEDDELEFWFVRIRKWLFAHLELSLARMFTINPDHEVEVRYILEESNAFGSICRTMMISPALWSVFLDSRPDLIAEDPSFLITQADQQIGMMLAQLLGKSDAKRTVPIICQLFDLNAEMSEHTLVYAALVSSGPKLFRAICKPVAPGTILPLRPTWCLDVAKHCLEAKQHETVIWISEHVEFAGKQATKMAKMEQKSRAATGRVPCIAPEVNELTPNAA